MDLLNEMKRAFLQAAAGEIEPAAWAQWWESHKDGLASILTPYMQAKIMPPGWRADYYWMLRTQRGIADHFYRQGRPVKCSDRYEKKAQEEEAQGRQEAMEAFRSQTAHVRQRWETYLAARPIEAVAFDWKSLQGRPPLQGLPRTFPYKCPATPEQWKETGAEIKLRLKENIQAKIAPLAKAYGMKKAGPQTFVREKGGLVMTIRFVGYFRGGGYECMYHSIGPLYDIHVARGLGLPGYITDGERFQKMQRGWDAIQFVTDGAVDADRVEKINEEFDDILAFLADGILPEWQKIDSLETYFAKERLDYLRAAEVGPADPHTGRALWDARQTGPKDPWREEAYLFGVWDLLSGREEEGYGQLAGCVQKGAGYMQQCLKMHPGAYNDKRDAMAVLYHNAELFLRTKKIADAAERRQAVLDTYEDVCCFMRYYHGLSKKVER